MRTPDDRYICDAEIGSPKKGWRFCPKPAAVVLISMRSPVTGGYTFLHACAKHEHTILENNPGYSVMRRLDAPRHV